MPKNNTPDGALIEQLQVWVLSNPGIYAGKHDIQGSALAEATPVIA